MEALQEVLQEAQRRGIIPEGHAELQKRLIDVDATDIRRLAKKIDGWQRKCVEIAEAPYDESTDLDGPRGHGSLLRLARTRGILGSDKARDFELQQFRKRTERHEFLCANSKSFDMNQYQNVLLELDTKTAWARAQRELWVGRLAQAITI